MDWTIENSIIAEKASDGSLRSVGAKRLYSLAFTDDASDERAQFLAFADKQSLTFSRFPVDLYLNLHVSDGRINTALVVRVDNTELTSSCFLLPIPEHIVVEGVWYPLNPASVAELASILEKCGIGQLGGISLRQYLLLRLNGAGSEVIIDSFGENGDALDDSSAEVSTTIELYEYQKKGVRWLRLLVNEELGGILGDEMGLGKTVQIISLLSGGARTIYPALIVAPTTILENWRRELLRFAPQLKVLVHRGSERTGFPSELREHDVVVTSYDLITRDLALLRQIEWGVVTLDEAQAIKNPTAQRTRAAKNIPRRVGFAVTGTPVQNHLVDLWSLADFALPGFLGSASQFERRYPSTEAGAEALREVVRPILLRRRVGEVAQDLPTLVICPQPLRFSEHEATEYERLRRGFVDAGTKIKSPADLVHLRMFCTHPQLLNNESQGLAETSIKYRRLIEILDEIISQDEKALVFTSFVKMIEAAADDVGQRFGIPTFKLHGGVDPALRQPLIDNFASIAGAAVLFLNPYAGGVGLNITAANHVIHYSLEWNPAVEDQATARAYRRGQALPVFVHRMFYLGSLEEIMESRLRKKRLLADTAVPEGDRTDDYIDLANALAISPIEGLP